MLKHALLYGFADRYFPAPIPSEPTLPTALAHGRQVAGAYVSTRRSESNFLRTASFLNQAKVTVGADGVLTVSTFRDESGTPRRWREVRPFVWREVGGKALLAARMKGGAVVGLSNSEAAPIYWLEPAPASLGGWNAPLLKFATAVLAIAALMWPLNALVRRRYGHAFALTGRPALSYRLTRVSALLNLAALAGWAVLWTAAGSARASFFDTGLTPWLLGLKVLTALAAISVLAPIWNLAIVWRDGARGWWAKLSSALIVAAGLSMIWFALNLRLIGLSTNY